MVEASLPPIWKNLPQLSLAERDRRWARIREEMALEGLDCLLVWSNDTGLPRHGLANLRYLTHLSMRGLCLFPRKGEPIIWCGLTIVSDHWKAAQQWVRDIRGVKDIRDGAAPEIIIATIKEVGLETARIGVVGFGSTGWKLDVDVIPYRPFSRILEALPQATFSDAGGVLHKVRMVKSPEEIGFMETSAHLADLMFETLKSTARVGAKECDLYANMVQTLVSNGGEPAMVLLDSGSSPLMHAKVLPATVRKLEKGDIIISEYHGNYGGYLSVVERSVSLGQPSPEYRDLHKVCEESYYSGLEKLKPGALFGDVIEAFRAPVKKAGMSFLECGMYAQGLGPSFPFCTTGDPPPAVIEENMVFATNHDLYNPKWRADTGLMLGDTLVVTKTGARKLTKVPVEFVIA